MTDLPSLWSSVVSAASGNAEVTVPTPRQWTKERLAQAAKIDAYLGGDWDPLCASVKEATIWGAPCRLDLSLERLTSRGCERLDSLLSGKWRSRASVAVESERRREEAIRTRNAVLFAPSESVEHRPFVERIRKDLE